MLEDRVQIVNQLGLHARAAAQLVRLANGFRSRITLTRSDNNLSADAKSILHVLTLGAAMGCELLVKVEGEDEKDALQAVNDIFFRGFGEI